MYLEIDEGYWEHPKTIELCAVLRDSSADTYPLRLWRWAVRSAKTGRLGKISHAALERVVRYDPNDGRLAAALVAVGFIDVAEDGTMEIHDWMNYTGGAIQRMAQTTESKRLYRLHREGKCSDPCEFCEREKTSKRRPKAVRRMSTGHSVDKPTQTRPDQTRPDQTRPECDPARARDPGAQVQSATVVVPPHNEHGKPSPHFVVQRYLAIRSELVVGQVPGANGIFQQPQPSDVAKTAEWLSLLSPEDCDDIEPAIRLACEHVRDGAQGWTDARMTKVGFLFACIMRSWLDLREELHGCAPKAVEKKADRPQFDHGMDLVVR